MPQEKLHRVLGLGECIFFGVGVILGAGIYTVIGEAAGFGGNMLWLSFLFASLTALMTAFSYAELSSTFPKAGGEYVYAKNAIGKKVAVILGIAITLNGTVSGAAISIGFAGYLGKLLEISGWMASAGIVALIYLVNIGGIRKSSLTNIIFTIIEVGGLLFVIYTAAPTFGQADYFELPEGGIPHLLVAAALCFYAYIGFEDVVKLSEETRSPEKNIPRALFISCAIVVVIYTAIALLAVSAISPDQLGQTKSPLADIVSSRFGIAAVTAISIIALFSTSNSILSNMTGSSRVVLEMAGESNSRVARFFAYVWPKTKAPLGGLTLIAIVMALLSLIGDIKVVALIANFFIHITFIIVNVCVIVLRIKDKELKRPFRVPGSIKNIPVISVLGILLTLVMVIFSIYGLTVQN
jgi:basic amino acid/polyamine antiporter, APA family